MRWYLTDLVRQVWVPFLMAIVILTVFHLVSS